MALGHRKLGLSRLPSNDCSLRFRKRSIAEVEHREQGRHVGHVAAERDLGPVVTDREGSDQLASPVANRSLVLEERVHVRPVENSTCAKTMPVGQIAKDLRRRTLIGCGTFGEAL